MGKLYAGIHFIKTEDSGMAKISLYNTTKSEWIFQDKIVDLYTSATNDPEDFLYQVSLPYADDEYEFTVVHSTYHNVSAISPYNINIDSYFTIDEINQAKVKSDLYLYHDAHNEQFTYTDLEKSQSQSISLEKTQTFSVNGIITDFVLSGQNRASDFLYYSDDNGVTWKNQFQTEITWGSNVDYDNETIGDDGYFGIRFDVAPTETVLIKYRPKANKFFLKRTVKQPTDNIGYIDYGSNIRLVNDILEMIP